ncbi:MAG: hypothetical protein P9L99_00030, partial [Candidatus Lernaella stagnicola]|nr:hypothetical protein [Candidatus Lernaella stagnicola]
MKRTIVAPLVLFVVMFFAVTAQAEYGEWEYLYGLQPPGFSNASFLNLSVGDYDHLYTVGIHQTSFDKIVYGWSSDTGGTSWNPTVVMEYDGSMCDMMKMFTIIIAVESLGPDVGVFGGFGIPEDCYENMPEPWCMFVCMLTLSPVIYVTDDGGATVRQAKVPFGFGKAVVAMDRAGDDVLMAVGGDDLIMRSTDGGETWVDIPTLPGQGFSYGDADFIDDIVGYVTTGESEPEPERAKDMTDQQWAQAIYDHRLNEARWLHDPEYRSEVRRRYTRDGVPNDKGMNGRIFKTEDGGNSWEQVMFSYNEAFSQIQMINEEEGWVWSNPLEGMSPSFRIYRTTDGGENWVDYTDRLPFEDLGGMAFGLMSFGFNPSGTTGFLGGGGQRVINFQSVLFYTADRGETWHVDQDLFSWGHPMVSFGWVDDKVAYQAGGDLSTYRYTQSNVPPIADAGEDQDGYTQQISQLDGSGSYDPDGDEITYLWSQEDGP